MGAQSHDALRAKIRSFLRLAAPTIQVTPVVRAEVRENGYTRQLVLYESGGGSEIEAFLFLPETQPANVCAIVLHQHNSQWAIGKSEVAGLAGDPLQAFAPALARRGVVVLAPDAIGFESRRGQAGEGRSFAPDSLQLRGASEDWLQYYNHAMHRLVRGELLMTQILADLDAAVTVVQQLSATALVGVAGHSYGGTAALFAAALDVRISFACTSGAACSFRHKLSHGTGIDMALVMPGFARRFDIDDLMRCVAPRRLFVVSSDADPNAADADDLVEAARPAFRSLGTDRHLSHFRSGHGHALDEERFSAIVDWIVGQGQSTPR